MKRLSFFLLVIIWGNLAAPVFPDGGEAPAARQGGPFVRAALASWETLLSNLTLFLGITAAGTSFSSVSPQTARENLLLSSWRWEAIDRFHINQAGHPYQGSIYFVSGRTNGFTFYQSLFFTVLGSSTWEIFFESARPALNDFVTTTIGGASLGEMVHRIYREFNQPRVLAVTATTLLSPMDRFQDLVVNRYQSYSGGRVPYLSFSSDFGYTRAGFYNGGSRKDRWDMPNYGMATSLVYGNPFGNPGTVPFEHFEASFAFHGLLPEWYSANIISDAYLVSFDALTGDRAKASTGLSLHFDFFNTSNDFQDNLGYSNLNISANSLDWTFKLRYIVSPSLVLDVKTHLGWIAWGNGNYPSYDGPDDIYADYATGGNLKTFLTLSHASLGRLDAGFIFYQMWTIPSLVKEAAGSTRFYYTQLSYSYPLTPILSVGIKDTFMLLSSRYDAAPSIRNSINTANLFIQWTY
ncbi:MAG: DUF3943 domain-containing protein [Spirochaetaceae bacterium]|jgi:hypothetical protein|nr:DUF3943 domain-containing protein [Spirochaetaceae bacterium]